MTSSAPAIAHEFLLPDVGEGLTEAEVVTWHVAVGDVVEVNQIIVEIETAKSMVELPSPYAGEVLALLVEAGTTADVGTPIIRIGDGGTHGSAAENGPSPAPAPSDNQLRDRTAAGEPKLLVGYGVQDESRRRRRGRPAGLISEVPTPVPAVANPAVTPPGAMPTRGDLPNGRPRAKPPVRKLAKALGIELASLTATGPEGTVTRDDLRRATEQPQGLQEPASRPTNGPYETTEVRIPIKGVRKQTAAAVSASAFTAVHVTEFVAIDVTRTLELREEVQRRREFRDVKLTPLAFVARAYLLALRRTPMASARWDQAAQEIVVPATVNLGIAAATPRGLVVPNIKHADRLSLLELALAINELAATARAGKTPPADFAAGTTTITNVGIFGVDTGTPILNPGESAILAVGAIRRMPWVVGRAADERLEARSVLQLALSFDHRVIDGQEGSQVLADTAALLTEPGLGLL